MESIFAFPNLQFCTSISPTLNPQVPSEKKFWQLYFCPRCHKIPKFREKLILLSVMQISKFTKKLCACTRVPYIVPNGSPESKMANFLGQKSQQHTGKHCSGVDVSLWHNYFSAVAKLRRNKMAQELNLLRKKTVYSCESALERMTQHSIYYVTRFSAEKYVKRGNTAACFT